MTKGYLEPDLYNKEKIEKMRAFWEGQVNGLLAYDEQLVRRLVEKIIVYEERLTVEFKSGLEIDVER